jgi:thiol-disulfide isomerase/thioredoxin
MLRLRAVLLTFLLLAPLSAQPAGASEITLDAERRSALLALAALRGAAPAGLDGRVVVLGFFASWCPPCGPEFDALNQIQAEFDGQGVEVLAVNIFEAHFKKDAARRLEGFLLKKAPDFAILGEGERVAGLFGPVTRIPTTFVFGRNGRPVMHFIHLQGASKTHASPEELRAAVKAAL